MFSIGLTRALPKANQVIRISFKEIPKILCYSDRLHLIGMEKRIKYLLGQIDIISNDYDT